MAYNPRLAQRLRRTLAGQRGLTERKMFGGLAFMLRGNMVAGVLGDDLVVRVGPRAYPAALRRRHAREFDFTGKPLCGFVRVVPEGTRASAALRGWVQLGVGFAASLRAK